MAKLTQSQFIQGLTDAIDAGYSQGDIIRVSNQVRLSKLKAASRADVNRTRPALAAPKWTAIKAEVLSRAGHNDPNEALSDLLTAIKADNQGDFWDAVVDLIQAQMNAQPHVRQVAGI